MDSKYFLCNMYSENMVLTKFVDENENVDVILDDIIYFIFEKESYWPMVKKFRYYHYKGMSAIIKFLIKLGVLEIEKNILTSKDTSVVCDKNNIKEKMEEML